KDLASALLGNQVGADELMILTGVDQVAVNYGKPDQRFLDSMTIAEAEAYLAEGQFPPGSMGPKISAAINFLRGGGRRVVISSIEKSALAVYGKAGTVLMGE
ncbi:MAG: carbamate kinase, partial [Calditrichaeota bacterium]|nr:carbamate kinase [Calditrichota bacterium]